MSLPPPLPPSSPNQFGSPQVSLCPACRSQVDSLASRCRFCGQDFKLLNKSNTTAGCLGFALGPVGLWYKGQWAAGFCWVGAFVVLCLVTSGFGLITAPLFWIGMGIHAMKARPKG